MTNFDGSIDYEVAQQLAEKGGYSMYSGWDFEGVVWMDHRSEQWACEVWCSHEHVETILASTLKELMADVSSKYGRD